MATSEEAWLIPGHTERASTVADAVACPMVSTFQTVRTPRYASLYRVHRRALIVAFEADLQYQTCALIAGQRERTTTVEAQIKEFPTEDTTRKFMRVREQVKRMLTHLTPTPDADGIQETPNRVARMWLNELTSGYRMDVPSMFRLFDDENYGGMVVVKDIPVTSVCEHHLVPIVGYAHLGYFPNGKVIGLSKLPRVVNAYARRLQVQERLTRQIHDSMREHLDPIGAIVVIEAEHLCMTIRGVQAPGTRTVTCSVSGAFRDNEDGEKEEFFRHVGRVPL